jgi:hypothetical protein
MSCTGCKQAKHAITHVATGIVGLTMSVLGPTATPEVISERTGTCDGCDSKIRVAGQAFCSECGCYLPALRRMRDPQCEKFAR